MIGKKFAVYFPRISSFLYRRHGVANRFCAVIVIENYRSVGNIWIIDMPPSRSRLYVALTDEITIEKGPEWGGTVTR